MSSDETTGPALALADERAGRPPIFLGMILFLASEVFLFGSLFWTYYYLRVKTDVWPPAGVELHLTMAAINTAVLLSSSLTIWLAGRAIRNGNVRGLAAGLGVTICLGLVFLGITGYEWAHETFRPWTMAYGSIFYTLTGFHALHVLGGTLLLSSLLARTLRGRFSARRRLAIEIGSLYWHYVDFIWILVFTTLFIVR
jgi:heme/copper-type cytochrome/quinol oxidase subunit 3